MSADSLYDRYCTAPFKAICELTGAFKRGKACKREFLSAVPKACDMGDALMCANGGICVQSVYNDTEYTCNCTEAFGGENCEIPKCIMPVDTFGICNALMSLTVRYFRR